MRIDILTLFPEMFSPLKASIIGRAENSGAVDIHIVNIRDYAEDRKHFTCDDVPYGGGAGMVMMAQPIADAIKSVDPQHEARRIYLSPKGKTLSMPIVYTLKNEARLLLLCGHYEGVDQRVLDLYIDEEISIGDYVLTGGELPAMVLVDAVVRQIDGVITGASLLAESFNDDTLEYPQYTRPRVFEGVEVPEVLLSGHHANIEKWRKTQSLQLTEKLRPDLKNK